MHLKEFIIGSIKLIFKGSKAYWAWVSTLLILIIIGIVKYYGQAEDGLIATSMRD